MTKVRHEEMFPWEFAQTLARPSICYLLRQAISSRVAERATALLAALPPPSP